MRSLEWLWPAAGSQHSNCVTKLSDIWYLDTDREDSNIWEPFDTILIFTGLARSGTWTWTTHELDQGAGAEEFLSSRCVWPRAAAGRRLRQRKEFCWSPSLNTKEYYFQCNYSESQEVILILVPGPAFLRLNILNGITDNYQISAGPCVALGHSGQGGPWRSWQSCGLEFSSEVHSFQ